jgi:hypothetical protein
VGNSTYASAYFRCLKIHTYVSVYFRCLKLPTILGTPYLEDTIFRRGRRFRIGKEGFGE